MTVVLANTAGLNYGTDAANHTVVAFHRVALSPAKGFSGNSRPDPRCAIRSMHVLAATAAGPHYASGSTYGVPGFDDSRGVTRCDPAFVVIGVPKASQKYLKVVENLLFKYENTENLHF